LSVCVFTSQFSSDIVLATDLHLELFCHDLLADFLRIYHILLRKSWKIYHHSFYVQIDTVAIMKDSLNLLFANNI